MKLEKSGLVEDLIRWQRAYYDNLSALSYSNNTIELYNRAIDLFIEYSRAYDDDMSLKEVKSVFFTSFLSYIENNAKKSGKKLVNGNYISKSTKQSYLKAIRGFFTFISDNNSELYTFERYFKNIKVADSSKMEEKLVYLSEDEITRLYGVLDSDKSKKEGYKSYRNSLLIKLMLNAGLRISEALKIRLDDFTEIDENIYSIMVYGKGGKEQIAYIGKGVVCDELEYFTRILQYPLDMPLMKSSKSDMLLDRTNAYKIVGDIYRKANIYKKGLHMLRHTLAMRLTQSDVNLTVIKKILRHSNIASTTIYARATEGAVVKAMGERRT